jgi:electron transport complex protein RnfE
MKHFWEDLTRGLWRENPTYRIVIGTCPTLAVTTAAVNGVSMGLSTMVVLICSSFMIAALKNVIPNKARIPCYIVIISTFVTVVDLFLAATFPDIHKVLGLFIPLIVVNCIILGRAEAFAGKNPPLRSAVDAVGMGLGFTWALLVMGSIREILGLGTWFGIRLFGPSFVPLTIMLLPPGGFFTFGLTLGLTNIVATALEARANRKAGMSGREALQAAQAETAASATGCTHCSV